MLGYDGGPARRIEPDGGSAAAGNGEDAVVRRQVDATEPISDAVLATLTALCDEAEHLPPVLEVEPLYETLDVGALDDLYTNTPRGDIRVEFRYEGYLVTVSDDSVVVEAAVDDEA